MFTNLWFQMDLLQMLVIPFVQHQLQLDQMVNLLQLYHVRLYVICDDGSHLKAQQLNSLLRVGNDRGCCRTLGQTPVVGWSTSKPSEMSALGALLFACHYFRWLFRSLSRLLQQPRPFITCKEIPIISFDRKRQMTHF